MKNFHKNKRKGEMTKRKGEMTPRPHLNLTMSTLGAGEPPCQQNKKRKKHKQTRQPKSKTKTP